MEPAKYFVRAAETEFGVQWCSGFDGTSPHFHRGRKIVRMYNRLPILYTFKNSACVIVYLPIDGFDFTRGIQCTDEAWNAIDDQAEVMLAGAECFLRLLPVFNVG